MATSMTLLRKLLRLPGKISRVNAVRQLSRKHGGEQGHSLDSNLPIAIFIPAIAKDLPTLPSVVQSIKRFVRHPITEIRIVAPAEPNMIEAAKTLSCTFTDERQLLPVGAETIRYIVEGLNRTGWIRQQLLKLNYEASLPAEHFLVVDADTAFVQPAVFEYDERILLFCSDEFHEPYLRSYRNLTGIASRYNLSFVSHHMLFSNEWLRRLKAKIESHTHKPWLNAVIDGLDPCEISCFSEYEMYGNFVYAEHRDEVEIRYWRNKGLNSPEVWPLDRLVAEFGDRFLTVSQHSWSRGNR